MSLTRAAAIGLVLLLASSASAQRPNRQMPGRPGRGQDQRAQLESDVRREFARVVRERVGLNDAQMEKLGPLTRKYEDQRRQTQMDERNARIRLQAALLDENAGDSAKVNSLVGQLMDIQKRRLSITEAEQKELGTIMTAHQRARFLGVQEQIRRRMEQLRPGPGDPMDDPMPMGQDRRGFPDVPAADPVTVRIRATPLRADILVDGENRGTGTAILDLSPGWHRLRVEAAGCVPLSDSVLVVRNQRAILRTLPDCK